MPKRTYETIAALRADGHPYATYREFWDHNASVHSGGQLPDPLESPEYLARIKYYQELTKEAGDRVYKKIKDEGDLDRTSYRYYSDRY
jgi:hypothetical protein